MLIYRMAGPVAASAFNRLGQHASSPVNRAFCYAELVVSSLAVAETIGLYPIGVYITTRDWSLDRVQTHIGNSISFNMLLHFVTL